MKPVLQALVLAEQVYRTEDGRHVICGTFTGFLFSHTPPVREVQADDGTKRTLVQGGMQAGAPYAYISLTDVCDGTKLKLQFVSLKHNKVMFSTGLTIQCKDRLATVEIVAPLPRLPISEEGIYAFEVVCEGEVIGSHRVVAKEK